MVAIPLENLMYAQSPEEKPKVEVRYVHHDLAMAVANDFKAEAGESQYTSEKVLSKIEAKQVIKKARLDRRQDRRQERIERRWRKSNYYYRDGYYGGYSNGYYRYGRPYHGGYGHRGSYSYCY